MFRNRRQMSTRHPDWDHCIATKDLQNDQHWLRHRLESDLPANRADNSEASKMTIPDPQSRHPNYHEQ
jgi:hypothetical protein